MRLTQYWTSVLRQQQLMKRQDMKCYLCHPYYSILWWYVIWTLGTEDMLSSKLVCSVRSYCCFSISSLKMTITVEKRLDTSQLQDGWRVLLQRINSLKPEPSDNCTESIWSPYILNLSIFFANLSLRPTRIDSNYFQHAPLKFTPRNSTGSKSLLIQLNFV